MVQPSDAKPVVLVTGSEGLIGDRIVQTAGDRYQIASFDIARPKKRPQQQDFINCDLTSGGSVHHALEELRRRRGSRLGSVVHLAAYCDFSGKPSHLYHDLTVEGTRRLLRGLQSFNVDQFIFSSTLLAMKPTESAPLNELSPTRAEWAYPQSKLETERVIQQEQGSIKVAILRIAGVYDEDCHSLPIAQQIARIHERSLESFVFPGNKEYGQAFLHLDDLATCIRQAIERRHELSPYEVFLVGEPDVMSYEELQDAIGQSLHGQEWPTIRIPKPVAKAGAWVKEKLSGGDENFIKPWMIDLADQNYPVEIGKAQRRLGWEPRHRLRETLPGMLRRLKADPERWYAENGLELPAGMRHG